MSTAASGTSVVISRAACRPSVPGMRTSMITPFGRRHRGAAVGGLADHADVLRAGQREAEAFAYHLMVIDDQTRDWLAHRDAPVSGSLALRQGYRHILSPPLARVRATPVGKFVAPG